METSLPTPMTARVYVNLPEGNGKIYGFLYQSIDGCPSLSDAIMVLKWNPDRNSPTRGQHGWHYRCSKIARYVSLIICLRKLCSSYGIISAFSWAVGFPVVPSSQNPTHWCYHRTVSNECVVSNPPCKVPQVEQTSNQYLTHVWLCLATKKLANGPVGLILVAYTTVFEPNEPRSAKICIQIQICPNSAASRPMLVAWPQIGFPVPLPRASNALPTEWKACCHQASWGSNWPTCGRPERVCAVNRFILGSPTYGCVWK